MVSNLYCEDDVTPPDDDTTNSGSLSGIEEAVYNVPHPGGEGNNGNGSGYVFSGDEEKGDYISVVDQMAGLSNLAADNTWMGGSDIHSGQGTQGWSLSDVSAAPRGGVFGLIRDAVVLDTASSTSGITALITAVNNQDPGTHTSGIDASAYQLTEILNALEGNEGSGLSGVFVETQKTVTQLGILENSLVGNATSGLAGILADTASIDSKVATAANQGTIYSKLVDIFSGTADLAAIRTNTALTQAGLSAVNIRASDGTTLTETNNSLNVHVNQSPGEGNTLNVDINKAFGSAGAMSVSSAGSLPVSIAGALVPVKVIEDSAVGLRIRNGVGVGSIFSVSSYGAATSILIDEDIAGDNPQTNTTIIAAPGSTNKLVIDGYNISMVGDGNTSFGRMFLTEGDAATRATGTPGFIMAGRCQGTTAIVHNYSSNVPIGLAANTALKLSTEEGNGNIFVYGSLQYRIVAL